MGTITTTLSQQKNKPLFFPYKHVQEQNPKQKWLTANL